MLRIRRSLRRRSPLPTLADDYDKLGFHYERGQAMFNKILLAAACACVILGGQQARGDDYVPGYIRSNGTYVAPYYRTHPDHSFYNNYSTYPNVNPYTGQMGTRLAPPYSPSYVPRTSFPSYRSPSLSPRASISPSYGRLR
jgi:hypothetical protein